MTRQGSISRSDGQPLGVFAALEPHFVQAFPGIKFALDRGPSTAGLNAFDVQGWMSKMKGLEYPAWVGMFEAGTFIIQFRLEGEQPVRKGGFAIYGHGIGHAKKRLDELAALTGWQIEL